MDSSTPPEHANEHAKSSALPLNAVHEFVLRMFPDGRELWTVTEILCAAQREYEAAEDLSWNTGKIWRAITVLRARRGEFPDFEFREFTSSSGYRYPPDSCRLIVREVINGRLPKNFQPKRDENGIKTPNEA